MRSLPFLFMLALPVGSAAAQSSEKAPPATLPVFSDVKTVAERPPKPPASDAPVPSEPARVGPERPERIDELPAALAGVRPSIPADRVFYDWPGDGNLWAKGAAYKARFGADGVRYIPYLGPRSPVNRPVDFRLESVSVGGRSVAFESSVGAVREGDVVSYDRGTLTELYVLAPQTLEQRFRFDAPPGALAAGEELVVRVGVTTGLALGPVATTEQPGGLEWRSPQGSVRYGRATVLDADGASAYAPTSWVGGSIEIRVPAAFLAAARYPLTIDPVISTFDVDGGTTFDYYPDIAYDRQTGRWGIVWTRFFSGNDYDVWCETRNIVGGFIEGAYIDITGTSWFAAKIANNRIASQYLVVAEVGLTGSKIVGGRTRRAASLIMSAQFAISDSPSVFGEGIHPDVGGDPHTAGPTYYCVVWERIRSATDHDVHARLVRADATLVPGGPILIDNSTADERNPAVSNSDGMPPSTSQVWTVVYEREFLPDDHDIRGAQIRWDGAIVEPNFSVDFSSHDDRTPTVSSVLDGASGPRPYLVAYRRDFGSDRDIVGTALRGGTPVTPSTNLTQLLGPASAFLDQSWPSLDSDGSTFVLAHSQAEFGSTNNNVAVAAMTLADGELLRREQTTLWGADGGLHETSSAICSQRSGGGATSTVMGVWNQGADIEGGRYGSPGPGDVYCTSLPHSGGGQARLSAYGSISIAENDLTLSVVDGPPNQTGLFFLGLSQLNQPAGEGTLCAGGPIRRIYPSANLNGTGSASRQLDFGQPYGGFVVAGAPGVNFQYWFRDPQGGPSGVNFSDALHIEFQP